MTRMLKLVRASCSYALSMADIASMGSYSSSDALKGSYSGKPQDRSSWTRAGTRGRVSMGESFVV
jgi:hypothetical protein